MGYLIFPNVPFDSRQTRGSDPEGVGPYERGDERGGGIAHSLGVHMGWLTKVLVPERSGSPGCQVSGNSHQVFQPIWDAMQGAQVAATSQEGICRLCLLFCQLICEGDDTLQDGIIPAVSTFLQSQLLGILKRKIGPDTRKVATACAYINASCGPLATHLATTA